MGKEKLEALYQKYPRKLGKSRGLKKLETDIKRGSSIDDMDKALTNFVNYHKQASTEPQFVPYFSTWATSWEDWLDADAGLTTLEFKKSFPRIQDILDAEKKKGVS